MFLLNKKTALLLFLVLITLQVLIYNYQEYIFMEPRSIHSWRQSDCLSFAFNFYTDRASFTQPCVNNLGSTGDGKVASDFPVIQYMVGNIWKITGVHTYIYRLFDLAFLFLGLLFIYKLYLYWFESYWLAIIGALIIFTSPILSYYGATTLSDIQSLGLSCAGFYYFILWLDDRKEKHLLFTVLLFSLAGLLKMSSAFVFATALSWFFIRILFGQKEDKNALLKVKNFIFLLIPFIPWYIWYSYAHHYNQLHPNDFFLIGITPIWAEHSSKIDLLASSLFHEMFPQMMHPFVLAVILLGFGTYIIGNIKKIFTENMLRIISVLFIFLLFITLFFQVFDVHDYYLLNMVGVLMIGIGIGIKLIIETIPSIKNNRYFIIGTILLYLPLAYFASVKTRTRLYEDNDWGYKPIVFNTAKHELLKWSTWDDRERYAIIEDKNNNFENYGVSKTDTILCLGDYTINRSLYLLKRIGYTDVNFQLSDMDSFITKKKKMGLKYLFILNPEIKKEANVKPFLHNKIFESKGTSVYKL
jgi:hypothetical protein